jgi:hypothetical protein
MYIYLFLASISDGALLLWLEKIYKTLSDGVLANSKKAIASSMQYDILAS